jgi:Uma2 family endonuclease
MAAATPGRDRNEARNLQRPETALASYWLIDPGAHTVTALRLKGQEYEVQAFAGKEDNNTDGA